MRQTNPTATPPSQVGHTFAAPDRHFPLGTDHLGRDELNQLQYGAGSTLGAASAILVAMMTIAFSVGTLSGYCGRWLDTLLMGVGEVITIYAPA